MNKKGVFLQALYLSYFALPVVAFYVSSGIRVVFAVLVLLFCIHNVLDNAVKLLPLYLISFCVAALNHYLSGQISYTTIYHYCNLYVISLIGINMLTSTWDKSSLLLSKISLVLLSVTCVTTTIGNRIFPGASRVLAGIGDQMDLFNQYMRFNIGGFDFVYMMVIIYPLVLCIIRTTTRKLSGIMLAILIAAVIIQTGYGYATLLFIGSTVLLFGDKVKTRSYIRKIIFALLLLVLFSQSLFPYILSSLAQYIPSEPVAARFNDLAIALSGLEVDESADVVSRSTQYQISINGFLSSPVWGLLNDETGGHSFLFDTLCRFGLLGALMFFVMLRQAYILFVRPFIEEQFYGYLLFSFFVYIICLIINPQPNLLVVSFAYPVLIVFLKQYSYKTI